MGTVVDITPLAYCPLCEEYLYEWEELLVLHNAVWVHETCKDWPLKMIERVEVQERWLTLWG